MYQKGDANANEIQLHGALLCSLVLNSTWVQTCSPSAFIFLIRTRTSIKSRKNQILGRERIAAFVSHFVSSFTIQASPKPNIYKRSLYMNIYLPQDYLFRTRKHPSIFFHTLKQTSSVPPSFKTKVSHKHKWFMLAQMIGADLVGPLANPSKMALSRSIHSFTCIQIHTKRHEYPKLTFSFRLTMKHVKMLQTTFS